MPTNKTLQALELITESLVTANVAVPIIFGLINGIAAVIRGLTGSGPSLAEIANVLEAKLDQNDAAFKAEIARMKALIAAGG